MTGVVLNEVFGNENSGVQPKGKGNLFIVSTRAPKAPLSGGMAPAVREASVGYDHVMWFALGTQDGKTEMGQSFSQHIPDEYKTPTRDYDVEQFHVRELRLTKDHWRLHYDEVCNRLIWPACHDLLQYKKDKIEQTDIDGNTLANAMLASAIAEELKSRGDTQSNIFIQDYHHFSLARYLRVEGVTNPITFFNHIPLPKMETFKALDELEQAFFKDMMGALLHCDSVQFQTEETAQRFLALIDQQSAPIAAYESITIAGPNNSVVRIGHAPISINAEKVIKTASWPDQPDPENPTDEEKKGIAISKWLDEQMVAENILLNFERCDYSKGILERVEAFRQLMADRPELRGKVQLVLQAEPTRTDIPEYKKYAEDVKTMAEGINEDPNLKVGGKDPVIFLNANIPNHKLLKIMGREKYVTNDSGEQVLQKRIGTVTPNADGMNLTAKEFAAAQNLDRANPLILSSGAGAAAELYLDGQGAVIYTPVRNNSGPLVNAIVTAIDMPQDEANMRAVNMQKAVIDNPIQKWGTYFDAEPARILELRPKTANVANDQSGGTHFVIR